MDALEFLRARGDEHVGKIAVRAGTTLAYFKQIAYRHRRPSVDLAKALERESRGDLSATEMLLAELKQPRQGATA
jgi:hypothetical protein